ncbi:MAG: DMT family transporter [Spirochaetaceae bacterium]|nr:DMT family transporter [Spirochaetaceae bacterium]
MSAGGEVQRRPGVVDRPPRADVLLMTVGLVAVSTSGPLMAAIAAPALAVALWRNVLGVAVIAPFALATRRRELREMTARERRWALGSGLLLAAHFATWVPSLRFTSVASATAIVATQPVWVALIARASGHAVPRRAWLGMGISVVAVILLTGVDFSLDPRALVGDLLALLGGVFAALYTVVGAEVRRTVSTTSYTTICYSTAAVALLAGCLVGRVDLWGYDGRTWLQLLALTLGAQLLGHSVFNLVLRTTSPTVASLFLLLEVPGAAVIAAVALGQVPPLAAVPAGLLLLVGLGIVVYARPDDVDPAIPAE